MYVNLEKAFFDVLSDTFLAHACLFIDDGLSRAPLNTVSLLSIIHIYVGEHKETGFESC